MAAGDPVATSFQQPAGQNIDNAKADALNNIAQSGAKGAAQMAATAQANAAARTQALQNAMAYSALRGAPSGNVDAAQSTVAQPFDQRASALGLMNDNYAQNNHAMQQANTNYMEGMKAGLPIAQTALDRTISNNQAANASKRDQQNYELSLKQQMADDAHQTQDLSRQIAQARLQAIQDKANKPLTPAQIIAQMGGQDATADVITQGGRQEFNSQPLAPLDGGFISAPEGLQPDQTSLDYGLSLGLPAGTVQSLLDAAASKDASQNKTTPPSDSAIRASDQYAKAIPSFSDAMARAGADVNAKRDAIKAVVSQYGPTIARIVIGDYSAQSKLIGP